MRTPYYRKKRKKRYKKRNKGSLIAKILLIVLIVLMALAAIVVGAYTYLQKSGRDSFIRNSATAVPDISQSETARIKKEVQEEYDPTLFRYDGKLYKYNSDMITILCMGVDKRIESVEKQEISGESGQADSIFLAALNPNTKKIKVISISRDTMTTIKNYDVSGNYIGDSINHLGLAYAYGDGEKESCEMMVEAVSKLFYDLPIHGYASILMTAIEPLNDAVGGVRVTVPKDMTSYDPVLAEGAEVTLNGSQAKIFLQNREMDEEGSNLKRMEAQKQYVLSFVQSAKNAIKANPTLPVALYQQLTEQMVTNINLDNAVYLVSQAVDMSFSTKDIVSVEGKIEQGAVYEEFYPDDKKLLELVLDTFYQEVPS